MRLSISLLACCAVSAALVLSPPSTPARAQDAATAIPPPKLDVGTADGVQRAVLAGGCFWGVQGVFQHTSGVLSAVSGYAGGSKATAHYPIVSTGATDHAEVVEIKYDPRRISYGKLLQIFFSVAHDPTQLDRQGPDIGRQYRSAIFATSDEQGRVAKAYIAQLDAAGVLNKPIATTVGPLEAFYAAEAYHQDYLTLHPNQPYIVHHDLPKIDALKRLFPSDYLDKPTLVSSAKVTTN